MGAFNRAGLVLAFPPSTDPRKTYKWRYLEHFITKVDEWGVEDTTAYKIIDAIVNYAQQRGTLKSKGLSILASDAVLEIGLKDIERAAHNTENTFNRLKSDHEMIGKYQDRLGVLLKKDHHQGSPNIVKWYVQGKLSALYLSVSKSCGLAIRQLDEIDRKSLPTALELLGLRRQCFPDARTRMRARLTLGDDWRDIC